MGQLGLISRLRVPNAYRCTCTCIIYTLCVLLVLLCGSHGVPPHRGTHTTIDSLRPRIGPGYQKTHTINNKIFHNVRYSVKQSPAAQRTGPLHQSTCMPPFIVSLSLVERLCTSAFSALFYVSLAYLCINYHKEKTKNNILMHLS